MTKKIQQIWAKKGDISVWDIGFGHYVAKFMHVDDYDRALFEGPWLIGDHYIVAEEWRPNFEPGHSIVNKIRAWVRLPSLPVEYFDPAILEVIENKTGKTIRLDTMTMSGTRGNFAHICVEIDLSKPLLSKYRLKRRVRRIEYEGLHLICFQCGLYGHGVDNCPTTKMESKEVEQRDEIPLTSNPVFEGGETEIPRPELAEDYGPWMLAKKRTRWKTSKPTARETTSLPMATNKALTMTVDSEGTSGSRFASLSTKEGKEDPKGRTDQIAIVNPTGIETQTLRLGASNGEIVSVESVSSGDVHHLKHGMVKILQRECSKPQDMDCGNMPDKEVSVVVTKVPSESDSLKGASVITLPKSLPTKAILKETNMKGSHVKKVSQDASTRPMSQ
ncbi:hypothetical protein LINPERHAP1_LOCUS30174 [Linum perenne]